MQFDANSLKSKVKVGTSSSLSLFYLAVLILLPALYVNVRGKFNYHFRG